MRVEVFFTPHQVEELYFREKRVVVVDVLRASTTIATALYNGAKEIIPVATVESAMEIVGNLDGDVTLLGGERDGKMIEGFHLGNSPLEYVEERVRGKSIVLTTSNGSQAILKARHAREMSVLGFVNISVIESVVREGEGDLVILCAGHDGFFSMEDAVCAGMLIHRLVDGSKAEMELGDAGIASVALYKNQGKSILKMLRNSEHGKYLDEIGFRNDLEACAAADAMPVVPQFLGNVVKLKKDSESIKISIPT
ncbi:2-phosphosulfolactate phosphatase [Sphingobacteriales bacterium CHB3]|nr:2-phosphosulfolactate phosphatase [Sphingobacteriales bacterium CHB3]